MPNHPWRQRSHIFTCEPDCMNRKPGCQDHCEKHLREKAEWDKRKAVSDRRTHLDYYISKRVAYYKDIQAKCDNGGLLRKNGRHK